MQQTATVLVESAPNQPLTEHPVNIIAEEQGLPCKEDMPSDTAECLSIQDWAMFVQYAESVDCFKQLYNESIPVATLARSRGVPEISLY